MPDQVRRLFHDLGGPWVESERAAVGLCLRTYTGGCREEVIRDNPEGRAVVYPDDGAVQHAGEFTIFRALRADHQV